MRAIWIKTQAMTALALLWLGGCAATKDQLLPHDAGTMRDIWRTQVGDGEGDTPSIALAEARLTLRRPLGAADTTVAPEAYTRTAQNEITRLFPRLPNPDLLMYVYPHLAGTEPTPVPGYSTVFPLYQRVPYALPGERTEAY